MVPEDTYSIAGFKENMATCFEKVIAGHIVYIQNHKRRGRPFVAAVVSVKDAQLIEAMKVNAHATP